MNRITITGGLTKDAVFNTTQSNKSVLNFDVANSQGYGDNEHVEYYRVSVWGKSAEGLNGKLVKGCRVVVSGTHKLEKNGEYTNNTINFADVEVVKWADNQQQGFGQSQPMQQPQGHAPGQAPSNDFGDDTPF